MEEEPTTARIQVTTSAEVGRLLDKEAKQLWHKPNRSKMVDMILHAYYKEQLQDK